MDPVSEGARVGHAPADKAAAVSSDQRTVLALLETVESVRSRTELRAGQYFELIEDPLLNLAVPVIISIVISIIKTPIIMLLIEIVNFFLMMLLAIPLALMLYPGVDPESIPGAEGVPGMKPSSPLAMAVQEASSSSTTTTTTTTVVEEEYVEEFLQTGGETRAKPDTTSAPWLSDAQVSCITSTLDQASALGLDRGSLLQTAADHISSMQATAPARSRRRSSRDTPAGTSPHSLAAKAIGLLKGALGRLSDRVAGEAAPATIRQRLSSLLQVTQSVTGGAGAVEARGEVSDQSRSQASEAAAVVLSRVAQAGSAGRGVGEEALFRSLHPSGLLVPPEEAGSGSLLQRSSTAAHSHRDRGSASAHAAESAAAAVGAVAASGAAFGGCEARRDAGSCTTSPLSDGTICSWCTSEGVAPHHADVWKSGSTSVGRCVACRTAWDQQMPETHGPDKLFWGHTSMQLSKLGWVCNPTPQSCSAADADAKADIRAKARAKDAQDDTQLYAMGLTDDDFPVGGTPKPPDTPENEMSEVAAEASSDALAAVIVPPFHATAHGLLAGALHTAIAREVSSRAVQSLAIDMGETLVNMDVVPRVQRGMVAGLSATLTRSLAADVAGAVVPTLALSLTRDPTEDQYCLLCEQRQVFCPNCRASQHHATNTFNSGWLYGRYFGRQFGLDAMQTVEQNSIEQIHLLRRVAELGKE